MLTSSINLAVKTSQPRYFKCIFQKSLIAQFFQGSKDTISVPFFNEFMGFSLIQAY
jgi:hypothetical protein